MNTIEQETSFQLWQIKSNGQEFKVGEPDTEKRIDNFRMAQSGSKYASYVSRPVPTAYLPPIKYKLRKQDWEIAEHGQGFCSLKCNNKSFPLNSARHTIDFYSVNGITKAVWKDKQDLAVRITIATT